MSTVLPESPTPNKTNSTSIGEIVVVAFCIPLWPVVVIWNLVGGGLWGESAHGPRGPRTLLQRIVYVLLVPLAGIIVWMLGAWEKPNNPWARFYNWLTA